MKILAHLPLQCNACSMARSRPARPAAMAALWACEGTLAGANVYPSLREARRQGRDVCSLTHPARGWA